MLSSKTKPKDEWVLENVIPKMIDYPDGTIVRHGPENQLGTWIDRFFEGVAPDAEVIIRADSHQDIMYFCKAMATSEDGTYRPNTRNRMTFVVDNVDSYPSDLVGAVQHNAAWDVLALRYKLKKPIAS